MDKYYVIKARAIPEVLIKVVEAKQLLDSGNAESVRDAVEQVGVSRSTFYKYKDDIFRFDDHSRGKTITLSVSMNDKQGLLSNILKVVASANANILTIHQSIPVSGVATVSLSVEIPDVGSDISALVESLQMMDEIRDVKILAGE